MAKFSMEFDISDFDLKILKKVIEAIQNPSTDETSDDLTCPLNVLQSLNEEKIEDTIFYDCKFCTIIFGCNGNKGGHCPCFYHGEAGVVETIEGQFGHLLPVDYLKLKIIELEGDFTIIQIVEQHSEIRDFIRSNNLEDEYIWESDDNTITIKSEDCPEITEITNGIVFNIRGNDTEDNLLPIIVADPIVAKDIEKAVEQLNLDFGSYLRRDKTIKKEKKRNKK